MFAPTTLAMLLAAAATNTSAYTRGRMAFCGRQACLPPNECRDVDGDSVCVRTDMPGCSGARCEPGFECALMQDVCASLPCYPKAYCVKSNPCGDCPASNSFCQMLPTPICRPIVQPTCENKICASGEICSEVPDAVCAQKPCLSKLVCTSASAWHQVASGLTGPAGTVGLGSSSSSSEELRLRLLAGSTASAENAALEDEDDD